MAESFELKCKNCGHSWVRRKLKLKPLKCPMCFSKEWDGKDVKK